MAQSFPPNISYRELMGLGSAFAEAGDVLAAIDQIIGAPPVDEPFGKAPEAGPELPPFKEPENEGDVRIPRDLRFWPQRSSRTVGAGPEIVSAAEKPFKTRLSDVLGERLQHRGDEGRWGADGRSDLPAHVPLIRPGQLRAVIGALGTHLVATRRVDVPALVKDVAQLRPILRLPRRRRRGFGDKILLVADYGVGMVPFQPDMVRLEARLKRLIGPDRLSVAKITREGQLPSATEIPAAGTVLILSDLQGYARRHGHPHTGFDAWTAFAAELTSRRAKAVVLSPGDGGDQVPPPAFPRLVTGPKPILGRLVPWDDTLTPRRMAGFASGRWAPHLRFRAAPPIGETLDWGLDLMCRLLSTVYDVDKFTLRSIRLALQDPPRLYKVLRAAAVDEKETPEFRMGARLVPVAPWLGAWHEYAIWTSDIMMTRGTIGALSGRVAQFDRFRSGRLPPDWYDTAAFAHAALLRVRAGRGLDQLVGDTVRWLRSQHRPNPPDQTELAEVQALLAEIAQQDGTEERARELAPGFRSRPRIETEEALSPNYLTLTVSDQRLKIGLNDVGADIRILLQPGEDLSLGELEIWRKQPEADGRNSPVTNVGLWPPGQVVSLADPATDGGLLDTVVLRLPDRAVVLGLTGNIRELAPCFIRNVPADTPVDAALWFDDEILVLGERLYDPIGLNEIGRADAAAEPELEPEKPAEKLSDADQPAWQDDGRIFFFQPDRRSVRMAAVGLPNSDTDDALLRIAVQAGHFAVSTSKGLWTAHPVGEGEALSVHRWRISSHWPRANALAVSAAGAAVGSWYNSADDVSTDRIHFFPNPGADGKGPAKPVTLGLELAAKERYSRRIAMSDSGLIAVRFGKKLAIFEPPASLADGNDESAGISSQQRQSSKGQAPGAVIRGGIGRTYGLRLLPLGDARASVMLEALRDRENRLVNTIHHAIHSWNLQITPAEIRAGLQVDPAAARLFSAVLSGQLDTLDRSEIAGSVNIPLPATGMTALHLAGYRPDAASLVERLVEAGADVNVRDVRGASPLDNTVWASDGGAAFRKLLDLGADPAVHYIENGEEEGLLAGIIWFADFDKILSVARLEELVARGANPKALSGRERNSLLHGAAYRGDPALVRFALKHDDRVDFRNENGWTPLLMAASSGNGECMRLLLGQDPATANAKLENGTSALEIAVAGGHRAAVAALLEHGADPNPPDPREGGERSAAVVAALVRNADEIATAELHGIAELLAKAGADADLTPFPLFPLLRGNRQKPLHDILQGLDDGGERAGVVRMIMENMKIGASVDLGPLIELPIDLNRAAENGIRLVHVVAAGKDLEDRDRLLEKMAQRGADFGLADDAGNTALHYAAACGHADAVEKILSIEPHLAAKQRRDGRTAGELATLVGTAAVLHTTRLFGEEMEGPAAGLKVKQWLADPPSAIDLARLSMLPLGAEWRELTEPPVVRTAGMNDALPVPLPARVGTWHTAASRQTTLPYDSRRILIEYWWQRNDRICGISAVVRDAQGAEIFAVDGHSAAIHEMNRVEPPKLEREADAIAYLKFFCHAVHGEEGMFAIIDNEAALRAHVPESAFDPQQIRRASASMTRGENGLWTGRAFVRYGKALFDAAFQITPSGMVEMLSDTLLLKWQKQPAPAFGRDGTIFYYA